MSFKEVDTYLETAMEKLGKRPHTIDEIGAAKKDWKEISDKKDEMRILSQKCGEKNNLLKREAPGTNIDISEVITKLSNLDGEGGRWDNFDVAMEAFNDIIEEQKEAMKSVLEESAITLNANIDKFGDRWKALKPSEIKV